ncbi:MAG: nucleotidyltransferase domain-containing protein [Clostridium sp.]|nr:nucleotidyltransferase domain-containing protein [Clostridium sp.]
MKKIRELFLRIASETKAILYGSQAIDDASEDSDIDFLILLPDKYDGGEYVRKNIYISDKLYSLSLELGIAISPFILLKKMFMKGKHCSQSML